MPQFIPVEHDPFAATAQTGQKFIPVEHDPFAEQPTMEGQPPVGADLSIPKKFLIGVGKGMTDIATGVYQRGVELGAGKQSPQAQKIRERIAQDREIMAPLMAESRAARVGEFVGQVAPAIVVPGGVGGKLLTRAGTSALAGSLIGGIQPTTEDESAVENAIKGALAGGLTSVAISAASKILNTAIGKLPASHVRRLSEKYKIPTTLSEEIDSPGFQVAESWLEKVPVIGIKGFREQQNVAAEQAAKNFLGHYIARPGTDDIIGTNRAFSSALYDRLKNTVFEISDVPVKPSHTAAMAGKLLKRYPTLFKQFQDVKTEGLIKNIVGDVSEKTTFIPTASEKLAAKYPYTFKPKKVTEPAKIVFDDMWSLRDGLGDLLYKAKRKLASGDVDKTQYAQLSSLFKAVNDDIDKWASVAGKPEITAQLKAANEAYKKYVVKYSVLQRAFDKASGETGAGEIFSPKKFSTAIKTIAYKDKSFGTFSPKEIDEMTGLANIMQIVKRAGQYKENPPTGARYGGIVTSLIAGAKTIPYAAALRILTTTEGGRRLALSASKIEPTNAAMIRIMEQLQNQIPKMAGAAAVTPETPTKPKPTPPKVMPKKVKPVPPQIPIKKAKPVAPKAVPPETFKSRDVTELTEQELMDIIKRTQ